MKNSNFNEFYDETNFLDADVTAENFKKLIERAAHLTREQEILLLEVENFENDLKRVESSLLNFIKIKGTKLINK